MSAKAQRPSAKLLDLYESLPPVEQRRLVARHLAPLVDRLPMTKAAPILSAASVAKARAACVPALNLKERKAEIRGLIAELDRDSKRAAVRDRSRKGELLEELAKSLSGWLTDIWSVAYEHQTQFDTCHRCLIFCADALKQIAASHGGCKCAFTNMYLPVTMKKRSGKVVKTFELEGAHLLEEVIFWVWRDTLLSMLATDDSRVTGAIPEMLDDMEETLGWHSLERMLYGGKRTHSSNDDYSDDYEDDEVDTDDEPEVDEKAAVSDDGDSNYASSSDEPPCRCAYHASHWPRAINARVHSLRGLVVRVLTTSFATSPCLGLYTTLSALSDDPTRAALTHRRRLAAQSGTGPDALAAALEVHAMEADTRVLAGLLDAHSALLRPRDAPALQAAVVALGHTPPHRPRAFALIERELLATARDARAAVRSCFGGFDTPASRVEALAILKLRAGTPARTARVERWVDGAVGPGGGGVPHAMAFAAAIMGVPVPPMPGAPGAGPDADDAFLDLDPSDPDLEDLREEYRPRLRERWEGWADVGVDVVGASWVLAKVYREVVEMMPFLRGSDMVDEMIARLVDRPSKHYVCDVLEALSSFVKTQRKKAQAKEKKRSSQVPPRAPAPPTLPDELGPGGLNDVD